MDKANAIQKAEKELQILVQKYKEFERKDSDVPPKFATSYSPRDGAIAVLSNKTAYESGFERHLILGVKVGTKFAEPKWYNYPSSENWNKARIEQKAIHEKFIEEARQILMTLKTSFGGRIGSVDGTAYKQFGWFKE